MNDLSHSYLNNTPARPNLVETFSDPADLQALRSEWNGLLKQDQTAGVFLSYDWLAPAMMENPGRWRVFVVRDDRGKAICIFPTKYRVHWSNSRQQFQTEIEAAGRLTWGERTGFICAEGQEESGLRALARAMATQPWKSLNLRYEPTGYRAEIFAEALGTGFTHKFREYRINKGAVDNLVQLTVPLDGGFESVLRERMSNNTRQKIRRSRRRLLETGKYRISATTADTLERDIAALLTNWVTQWTAKKGKSSALAMADGYARALLTADSLGKLYLPTLWKGNTLLGALGHVVDERQGCVHFLLAGRNPKVDDPAIGLLLHAEALEWAAKNGFQSYGFGHGDQDYKRSFGVEEGRSHYLSVRKTGAESVLDKICIPAALQRAHQFALDQKYDLAERGLGQLAALTGSGVSQS